MNFKDTFRSIQETGGASFNVISGALNPTNGYMVSLAKDYERKFVIPQNLADFSTVVRAFMVEHWDRMIDAKGNTFIGFWIHDGELYVDLVENIQDFEEAYTKGFEKEQIAIHDCKNKRDITIIYCYPY